IQVEPDDMHPIAKGSDGFAKHDAHADPKFTGTLPTAFPFANADVMSGTTKVSDILKHYRALYTPATGSPLIGTGDPTLGANNNIGAIGQGTDKDSNDQFGTFMPGPSGGPPPLTSAVSSSGSGTSVASTTSGTTGASATTGTSGTTGASGTTGV